MARIMLLWVMLASWAAAQLPDRNVRLQKVHNTRSLAGIPCQGGRLKAGMIYRSTCLAPIARSPADMQTIRALKLTTIIDLRTRPEVKLQGADPALALKTLSLPLPLVVGRSGYRSYLAQKGEIHRFFDTLSQPDSYPVLYHCYEGKDRTGVMTALLLQALGSSPQDIQDDYLQSRRNGYKVNEDWLAAALDVVRRAGGIEAYLQSCGVEAAELARLRALLIERF